MYAIIPHTFILIITGFLIYEFNLLVKSILEKNNDLFNSYTLERQLYIVKNITKSIILFFISIRIIYLLINSIKKETLNNFDIKTLATLYVAGDIVALLTVPGLPESTRRHHMATTLLLFVNYLIDYEDMSRISTKIGILLIGYATFSAFSFLVNLYLGSRFIISKKSIVNKLRQVALNNYKICIYLNWTLQILFMLFTLTVDINLAIAYLIYTIVFIPIVQDDLILVSWLSR